MGTLALVRHGQASIEKASTGGYDQLSERGVEQARALGARWAVTPPTAIYSGPMRRQLDTAGLAREVALAAGHTLPPVEVLPGLAELPAFELFGRALPQVLRDTPALHGLVDGSAPAGERRGLEDLAFWSVLDAWIDDRLDTHGLERYAGFVARIDDAIATMVTAHHTAGARVAAVTSGGPIGVALGRALHLATRPMLDLWRTVRNASITELRWRSADASPRPSLLAFNLVDHLPPALHTFR